MTPLLASLLVVFWIVIGLFWSGAALLVTQALREPEDVPLRYFAAMVTAMAVSYTTAVVVPADSPVFHTLFIYLVGLATGYVRIGFFRSLKSRCGLRGAMRRELLIAVVAAVITVAAWVTAPPALLPVFVLDAAASNIHALIFNVTTVTYFLYVSIRTVMWAVELVPRVEYDRALRVCLVLIGLGSVVHIMAEFGNLYASLQGFGASIPRPPTDVLAILPIFTTLGFAGLILGVLVQLLASIVAQVPQRREFAAKRRALRPLRRALRRSFPRLRVAISGTQSRYYRSLVEIRDGLLLLWPHTDAVVARQALDAARGRGESEQSCMLTAQAMVIAAALASHHVGHLPDERFRLISPEGDDADWNTEAAWLIQLSQRFAALRDASRGRPGRPIGRIGSPSR